MTETAAAARVLPTVDDLDKLGEDHPIGISEIANALNVGRQTVDIWRVRNRFPDEEAPFRIGGRPWWRWGKVRAWAIETGRLVEAPDPIDPPLGDDEEPVTIPPVKRRSH